MKRLVTLGVLMLLALSFSTAQQNPGPRGRMATGRARVLQELKLTDAQRKDIEKLRFDLRKQSIDLQARIKTQRLELTELFKADNTDQSAVEKKVNEISKLQAQRKLMLVDHWFAVNKLLTPEQQKVWKKASAQFLMQRRAQFARAQSGRMMRRPAMERWMRPAPGAMNR